MSKLSKGPTEKEHLAKIGAAKYERAYALAALVCRQDARFVGLDKIRSAIAHEAALQATGFRERPLILPRNAGPGLHETQTIAEEVLAKATTAAREKLDG